MFWVLIALLFCGLLLILLELFAPYGLSFTAGLGVIVVACYLGYQHFEAGERILYLLSALILATVTVTFVWRSGIRWLSLAVPPPKSRPQPTLGGAANQGTPEVGQEAKVVAPLRPTGTVLWGQQRFPARTLKPETECEVGQMVEIKGMDSIYLLVEPPSDPSAP